MQMMYKALIFVCGLVAVVHAAPTLDYNAACPSADGTDTCDGAKNLYCYQKYSTTGCTAAKCDCKRGFKRVGTACVTGLSFDAACTPGVATDACDIIKGECVTDKCACSNTFEKLAEFCIPATFKKIGETCTTLTDTCYYESEGKLVDIACPTDAGGSATSTCQCGENTKQFGTSCRPIKIGDSCALPDDCPISSSCSGDPKVCTCQELYQATTDKTACVLITAPIAEGQVCTATTCAAGLTCSTCSGALTCAQRTGLLGEACTIASDCASNVAVCTDSKCACQAGYEAFGVTQCLITGNLDSVCLDAGDCTTPAANVACTNRVCACAATYKKEGNACIKECTAPTVVRGDTCVTGKKDGDCDSNDHCTNLDNSQCKDNKCTCADDSTVSGETCVKSGVGIKAAWMPIILLSGLIPVLMMMLR